MAAPKVEVYQVNETFYVGGTPVYAGETVVAGHPLMRGRRHLFRPFAPTYGHVPEPDAPPKSAPEPEPHVTAPTPDEKPAT